MPVKVFAILFLLFISWSVKSQELPDSNVVALEAIITVGECEAFTSSGIKVDCEAAGGSAGWKRYLSRNLLATVPLSNNVQAGSYTVVVHFIVSKDGSITNISAETKQGYGMEEELMRIIKKGPGWVNATRKGTTEIAYRRQAVSIVLREVEIDL